MTKKHDIIWLNSVDSTNSEAERRIHDIDNLSVLSALEQTEGRGQRGNTWSSMPSENLTFSIVLKFAEPGNDTAALPVVNACDQFVLTEIAAISAVSFLEKHDISAKIKWPNDIYIGKKKICGMLIQNSVRGDCISSSIIGIGLNINQRNFDVNLPNPTSMLLCMPDSYFDIKECLEEFMEVFKMHVSSFLSYTTDSEKLESYKNLRGIYLSKLWLSGEPASFEDLTAARIFPGTIRGLSPIGHLQIEDNEKGELKEFAFKEIRYIL